MNRKIIITACVFGIIAVISGAFGAHGLKNLIAPSDLENWKTAVNYQFYHILALLFLSAVPLKSRYINFSYYTFSLGIILFSGSLYLLATRSITGLPVSVLGPITPLGGLMFILGWVFLLLAAIKNK
ncbi:DUF423 domain-containing protein [Arcticibacter eurypsychrophilus]|uniref:DUF423 domain-containing protein n=1 Tax=Arcticibacter eurypsychrophilus TaxID=1434752 RepID=UPI00084D810A|nr:DUF423 domain-containing protein [Arcticibacter eurypsychrophilus]